MNQTPKTKKAILAILISGIVLSGFPSGHAQTSHAASKQPAKKSSVVKAKAVKKKPKMAPRRIDGVADEKSKQNQWMVAVMIDNHTAARPQAGLSSASVIYEALAEGGIPRFMAVFVRRDMPLVGPVRSVRPYFVKWATEYYAAIAHAGGSPDGQKLLKQLKLPNMEGTHGPFAKYFYRIGRNGPHNLFTNGRNMEKFLKSKPYTKKGKPTYSAWAFDQDPPLKKRPQGTRGINIDLGSGRNYTIKYLYDRKTNSYLRYTGGRPHIDRNNRKQIAAKNVVIQMVPKEKVIDRKKRIDLQVTGKGNAILFKNGFTYTIKWEKESTKARTKYTYQDGKEVVFTQGLTFITALPKGRKYSVIKPK